MQSAVNARRGGEENPNSSVVAEVRKLLAKSSYGYQIVDRSRHTVTKFLSDEKTHGAINTRFFKRLDHINGQLYEVELAKADDVSKIEELEMDTDSLYLALSEKELYDCIREESKVECELMRTEDCKGDFTANATTNFFPRTCCAKHKKHDKREPGLFKEDFR